PPCCAGGPRACALPPSGGAGLFACCLPADASAEAATSFSGVAVATPPFALGGLRFSSTVRPILRRPSPTRAGRAVETTIRVHAHDACVAPASICPPWFRRPRRGR